MQGRATISNGELSTEARRARAAAAYIPRGARVLALGAEAWAVEPYLGATGEVVRVERQEAGDGVLVCDFEGGQLPACDWDVAVVLGRLERCADLPGLLRRLRARGRPVVFSYVVAGEGPVDRRALGWRNGYTRTELGALFGEAGYARACGEDLDGGEVLLRLDPARPRPKPEKAVWVLSCNNNGNFGDRLGVHLLSEVLPAHAVVRHLHHVPFDAPPEGAPDLLIVGIGNSVFHPMLTDELAALMRRAPLAVGVFGTQYRELIPRPRMDALLDRLHLWYARYDADALIYGRGRDNVRPLGDWLIHACPMARPTRDEELRIGPEVWDDVPLDRYIGHIQSFRRVGSPRLHPLLCAITSAEEVAYVEQTDYADQGAGPSGKFRSMLIDVFGHEQPPGVYWPVDRGAVSSYKQKVAENLVQMRAELARLLD